MSHFVQRVMADVQHQAVARLGDASEAHHEFNREVVDVNRGLAAAYRRVSEDPAALPAPAGPAPTELRSLRGSRHPIPYRF